MFSFKIYVSFLGSSNAKSTGQKKEKEKMAPSKVKKEDGKGDNRLKKR